MTSTLLDTVKITVANSGTNYGFYSGSYGSLDSSYNDLPGVLFTDGNTKAVTSLYDGAANTLTLVHATGTLESISVLKRYSMLIKDASDNVLARFNLGGDSEATAPVINDSSNSYTIVLDKFANLFKDANTTILSFEIYSLPSYIIRRDPSVSDLTRLSVYAITAYGQSSELALTSGLAVQSGNLGIFNYGLYLV